MNILTVAVVPSLNERGVDDQGNPTFWCDPQYAPIWTDGTTDYLVASGLSEEDVTTSSPITAQPDRVNIAVGMDGLAALEAMGLVVKNEESEE
jgi:hypothetical protein